MEGQLQQLQQEIQYRQMATLIDAPVPETVYAPPGENWRPDVNAPADIPGPDPTPWVPDENAAFQTNATTGAIQAAPTRDTRTGRAAWRTAYIPPPVWVDETAALPTTVTYETRQVEVNQAPVAGRYTGATPTRRNPRVYGNIPTEATAQPIYAAGLQDTTCIPFDHPILERIRTIVPPELHDAIWVGGSAACAWGQHGDVDVWIGYLDRDLTTVEERLVIRIGTAAGNLRNNEDDETIYPDQNSMMVYAGVAPDGTKFHIMQALVYMPDVLAGFDISCHAVIQHAAGSLERLHHEGWTSTDYVRILSWHSAKTTLERAIKFAKRYGDDSMWTHSKTGQCAAEACDIPYVTPQIADMLDAMQVDEGL